MTVWFVGVDLAWSKRNPTGVAILEGGPGRPLAYVRSETYGSTEEIAGPILALDGPVWVAIDAPLVVPNETGQRPVDRLVTRQYGRFHAGAYPANLKQLGHDVRAEKLVGLLAPRGVRQLDEVTLPPQAAGSWAFETYPHPAMIELFGMDRIDQVQEGPRSLRSGRAFARSRRHAGRSPAAARSAAARCRTGCRRCWRTPPAGLRGKALGAHEDRLDAPVLRLHRGASVALGGGAQPAPGHAGRRAASCCRPMRGDIDRLAGCVNDRTARRVSVGPCRAWPPGCALGARRDRGAR